MLAAALIIAQLPPPLTVVNAIDADDLYNITTGDPGTCQCESPKCGAPGAGTRIMHGESKKFGPAGGCYYFALGGGIKASGDGMICRTWRADSKGCNIYPGSTDGNCSRILTTPCSVAGGVVTLNATIDRACTTLPYKTCTDSDICCGGSTCQLVAPGSPEKQCRPKTVVEA